MLTHISLVVSRRNFGFALLTSTGNQGLLGISVDNLMIPAHTRDTYYPDAVA